jgi:hypothetical protein
VGLLWNGKANGDLALRTVQDQLEQAFPDVKFRFYPGRIRCETALLEQAAAECDVVVGCTADCGSCTSWMAHDCIQLERMGVPAVAIVSDGFQANFAASARAFALPALEFVIVPHVFNNSEADVAVRQTVDIVPALTRLLTGLGGAADGAEAPSGSEAGLTLSGDGVLGGMRELNDELHARGMTDGYPVWPPLADRVEELVAAVGGDPGEVLFALPPGNGEVTLEKLAANCVMAGCTPAEMLVVEAALRALTDVEQRTMIRGCLMSTSAHAPVVVVNGPIAEQLGLNGGRGCVGPGTNNLVNLRISRAISLCLHNLGRWAPGVMDLDTVGTPRKNIVVVAENQAESPWSPFHVDHGSELGTSTATVFFSVGEWDVGVQGHIDPEQLARAIGSFSGGNSGTGYFSTLFGDTDKSPVGRLMFMAPTHARALAEGGLSKEAVRDILFESGKETITRLIEPMRKLYKDGKIRDEWLWVFEADQETQDTTLLPVIERAEEYHIVVTGSGRGKDLLMPTRCRPVSREIRGDWLRGLAGGDGSLDT